MKILYLHQYFNTPEMSGGTRSYEMARRLVANGHEVHVLTSWREDNDEKVGDWVETEEAGIKVHWLSEPYSNHMNYGERVRAFFRFAWNSSRRAASIPTDVIFATSTPLTIALPGVYASRKQRIPMVFEVRDLWPELPIAMGALRDPFSKMLAKKLERFAYSHSSRIVALSPGMKNGVVKTGYPEAQVNVIPNSSDIDLFDPETSDSQWFRDQHPELGNAPLVVYTGTMGAINGVDYLVELAAAAQEMGSDTQFAVVGRGGKETDVREKAQKMGVLGSNFHIFDPVPKAKMPNVLASASLALSLFIDLKPMWANSANKFFDALASGTPVAINYGGWQSELLDDSGAGIVLPVNDPEGAAKEIEAFLADEERQSNASAAARRLAEEQFSRDKLAVELEKLLLEAVEQV